jgi:hypothetical protein
VQRSVILAAFAVCLLAAQAAFAQSTAPGAVTVFTARKIVTMDPGWPEATAVAVQDGRILSVGTLDDLQPWLRRFPHTIPDDSSRASSITASSSRIPNR